MNHPAHTEEFKATFIHLYTTLSPQDCADALGLPLKRCYRLAHQFGAKTTAPRKTGRKPDPTLASRPCLPVSKPAKASARGPAWLPGEPIFTAATKRTYGPSPQPSLRTSTFLE